MKKFLTALKFVFCNKYSLLHSIFSGMWKMLTNLFSSHRILQTKSQRVVLQKKAILVLAGPFSMTFQYLICDHKPPQLRCVVVVWIMMTKLNIFATFTWKEGKISRRLTLFGNIQFSLEYLLKHNNLQAHFSSKVLLLLNKILMSKLFHW